MQYEKKRCKISSPPPLKLQNHRISIPWGKATAESLASNMFEKSCVFMEGEVYMETRMNQPSADISRYLRFTQQRLKHNLD